MTALLVAWLAWRIFRDKRVAILSPIIFLTAMLVYAIGTYAVLDPMITLWLALAMCSFWGAAQAHSRSGKILGYALLGVACGMGGDDQRLPGAGGAGGGRSAVGDRP